MKVETNSIGMGFIAIKHGVACEKYGYRTDIGSSDSEQVIASFKENLLRRLPEP
jgi:hypothetical protein